MGAFDSQTPRLGCQSRTMQMDGLIGMVLNFTIAREILSGTSTSGCMPCIFLPYVDKILIEDDSMVVYGIPLRLA